MTPHENAMKQNSSKEAWLTISSDLATDITGRARKLLDWLLPTLTVGSQLWRRIPILAQPVHQLGSVYMDWVRELVSRLYLSAASVPRFSRSSHVFLSPASFTWFNPRWWQRRKRYWPAMTRWDETIDDSLAEISLPLPDDDIFLSPVYYSGEDETYEAAVERQKSKALGGSILELLKLPTLPPGDMGLAQRKRRTVTVIPMLQLPGKQGSHEPTQAPFEPAGKSYYYPEFIPAISVRHSEAGPILPPRKVVMMDKEPMPAVSHFVPLSLDMSQDSEVPRPLPVASNTVSPKKATDAPDLYLPGPRLIHRDQTADFAATAFTDFSEVSPRLVSDQNPGFRQLSLIQGLMGNVPLTLGGKVVNGEAAESAETKSAGTIAQSAGYGQAGGLGRNLGIGLALAPVGRRTVRTDETALPATTGGEENAIQALGEAALAIDTEVLASGVYDILKRRLLVERERTQAII